MGRRVKFSEPLGVYGHQRIPPNRQLCFGMFGVVSAAFHPRNGASVIICHSFDISVKCYHPRIFSTAY
jgi:hypothetical protein